MEWYGRDAAEGGFSADKLKLMAVGCRRFEWLVPKPKCGVGIKNCNLQLRAREWCVVRDLVIFVLALTGLLCLALPG